MLGACDPNLEIRAELFHSRTGLLSSPAKASFLQHNQTASQLRAAAMGVYNLSTRCHIGKRRRGEKIARRRQWREPLATCSHAKRAPRCTTCCSSSLCFALRWLRRDGAATQCMARGPSHRDRGSMRRSSSRGTSSQIAVRGRNGTKHSTIAERESEDTGTGRPR
jgi:hypothetical protein